MESTEIQLQLGMTYNNLVKYLLKKYGKVAGDYYNNANCKSKNRKILKTSQGLYIHHIDEDKAIMLSNDNYSINNPFEYQKADRLVYANIIEHLLLHIKITEEPRVKDANPKEAVGVGGVINFIAPEINDFYNGFEFKQLYRIKSHELIKENFNDYIQILKYVLKIVSKHPALSKIITKEIIASGFDKKIINKIYDKL